MASKKDNQLKTVEPVEQPASSITYANEVIATIAGMAVSDVEGVAGMSKGAVKNRNVTKGIRVEVNAEDVACDIFLLIEYGRPIQKVAFEVQENVRRSLESMTGLHVSRVDVHVQGVSFEKENSALNAGAQHARLTQPDAEGTETKAASEKKETADK